MDTLNALQQTVAPGVSTDTVNQLLLWSVVPTVVFLLAFAIYYIIKSVHRHKVDTAIFEIRDMLLEMRATSTSNETHPRSVTEEDTTSIDTMTTQ